MYELFLSLLNSRNLKASDVAKATGINQTVFSEWKKGKSNPKFDKIQKIADFFDVPPEYFSTGKITEKKETILTQKDEKDIKKDLDNIMSKIRNGEDGPIHYNGEEIDEESMELFQSAMEHALKTLKTVNKEKYNPNKNKK